MKLLDISGLTSVLSKLIEKISVAYDSLEVRVTANENAVDGKADKVHSHEDINELIKQLYVNNYNGSEEQLNTLTAMSGGVSEKINLNRRTGDTVYTAYVCNNGDAYIVGIGEMEDFDAGSKVSKLAHNTSIKNMYILNGAVNIGEFAFSDCRNLASVIIPNSVKSIGGYAFYYCKKLTSITIPNSVTAIGDYSFNSCIALEAIYIPTSVTTIGKSAFLLCSALSEVYIPASVTTIGEAAFANTQALEYIYVSEENANYTSYGGVLYNKNITILMECPCKIDGIFQIPETVTDIGTRAFQSCTGLTSITIPNSVTSIGSYAFGVCTGLTSITIPNSVTSIGSSAFYSCTSLTTITINKTQDSISGAPWGATNAEVVWTGGE